MPPNFFQLTLKHVKERSLIITSSIICFTLSLLCYGQSLFSAYTPDDYLLNVQKIPLAFFLQQGRFVQGIISFIFNKLNIPLTSSGFAFEILFFVSLSICATYFAYYLSNKSNFLISFFLSTAIIVSNPIFSTMAAYHGTVINYSFCFIFLTCFFYYTKSFLESAYIKDLIIASIFLTLVCGSYQPCLPIAIIWSIFYTIVHYKNYHTRHLYRLYIPIISGLIFYIILYVITKNAAGANDWDQRVGFISLQELFHRATTIITFFSLDAWKKYQIIPHKALLLLGINILILLISYGLQSSAKYLSFLIAMIVSVIIILLPISIVKIWSPTARSIIGFAFCYGIAFLYVKNNQIIQIINYSFAVIILLFSIIISNAFLDKINKNNVHDQWITSALASALLKIDSNQKEITIVNNHNRIKVIDWSFKGLFYTYTGNIFNFVLSTPYDKNICKNTPIWPKKDSIYITNNKIIICL